MLRVLFSLSLALLLQGCLTDLIPDSDKAETIKEINETFRVAYEQILVERGTRVYKTTIDDAFPALRTALARVGMRVANQAPGIGYLSVVGPAPAPLNDAEWQKVREEDRPKLREIARRHLGILGNLADFEPEGLEVIINATVLDVRNGVEISLTARMHEIAPPKSGLPRREYLPPSAVRMGLDKIWGEVERELRSPRIL